jgi:hypothetical protein
MPQAPLEETLVHSRSRMQSARREGSEETHMSEREKQAQQAADKLEARVRFIMGGRNLAEAGILPEDGDSGNSFPAVSWPKRWLVDAFIEALAVPAPSEPPRKPSFDDPKRQLSAKPKLAELVGKLQHNYQAFPAPFAHEKSYWEKNGPVNCTACQFQVALAELRALVEEWCVYNPHPSTPISETYHNCKESLARRNHEA